MQTFCNLHIVSVENISWNQIIFSKNVDFTEFFQGYRNLFNLHSRYTVWKNEKFSLTEKIFREINSLVKTLIWRKKCWFFRKNSDRILWYFSTLCRVVCIIWESINYWALNFCQITYFSVKKPNTLPNCIITWNLSFFLL